MPVVTRIARVVVVPVTEHEAPPAPIVATREGAVSREVAAALGAAVQQAGPSDALVVDGVAVFQLTLDGYAADGLDEFTEHLFATGTLTQIPGLPFIDLAPDPADVGPADG